MPYQLYSKEKFNIIVPKNIIPLNPKIFEMIEYAKKRGIKEVSTLTHGGFLDPEKFEKFSSADFHLG